MNAKANSTASKAKLIRAPSGQMRPAVRQMQKPRGSNRSTPAVAGAALEISAEVLRDAESYLQDRSGNEPYHPSDKDAQKHWLKARLTQVNKQRRSQHIRALSDAYAMYVMVESDPSFRQSILQTAEAIGKRADKNADDLRTIVELHMVYDGDGSQSDTKKANGLYSRDVNAIKGLIYNKILPSSVPELGRAKGQGLDCWSRLGKKRSYLKPAAKINQKIQTPPWSQDSSGHDVGEVPPEQVMNKSTKTLELNYRPTNPNLRKTILTWGESSESGLVRLHYSIETSSEFNHLIDLFFEKMLELNSLD